MAPGADGHHTAVQAHLSTTPSCYTLYMTIETIADLAVAVGTAILAFTTWRATTASQIATRAAEQTARAAQAEADATMQLAQEARKDRELAWRPHLDISMSQTAALPDCDSIDVAVTNVGNGPALDCRIWLYATNRWAWRDVKPLAAQQRLQLLEPIRISHQGGPHPFPEGMFDPPPDGRPHHGPWVTVVTCTDVLGNRWRFMNGQQPERIWLDHPRPPLWIQWLGVQPTENQNAAQPSTA